MKPQWTALALIALWQSPLSAGVVIEMDTYDGRQPPQRQTIAIESGNVAIQVAPQAGLASGGTVVYRAARREIMIVDHANRSFLIFDAETLRSLSSQLQMLGGMAAQPGSPAQPPRALRTTDQQRILGYPCVRYEAAEGYRRLSEYWVTNWDNIEGGREAAQAYLALAEFMEQMTAAMGGQTGGAANLAGSGSLAAIKALDGFPVAVREYNADGTVKADAVFRAARRQTLDPALFEPPVGYQRQQIPVGPAMGPGPSARQPQAGFPGGRY